jgi:hypothetical protein
MRGVGLEISISFGSNKSPKHYIGIDVEDHMIEVAMSQINAPFYVKDILHGDIPMVDYYVSSGAMNIMTKEESLLFIKNIYEHSKRGVIFNLLHSHHVNNHDIYNSFNLYEALDYAKTLSTHVEFKEGYLEGDFTIHIQKERA